MVNKEILARVKHKRDTSSNWTQNNPVLLNGEIILVDTAEGELRAKIGDGVKTYTQLPFSDEALRSLINNNKVIVDDALSSTSTNPVQNKAVNTAITNLNNLVGDSSVSEQISTALVNNQPDWNQNDTTAADYIKNRPFYTGNPVKTEIIPATTVTFSDMNGAMTAVWPESFDLVDGQTYCVSWDGTDYVCTGILFNGAVPILGNLGILGAGDDTGEPFVFLNQGQWLVESTESATEHIIGIDRYVAQIVPIDKKYLPASAFTEAEWDSISNRPLYYKQLNVNIAPENITQDIIAGANYVNFDVTVPDFNEGLYYKVEGEVSFLNNSANMPYTLQISGYYKADSRARISLGTVYDTYGRRNLDVSLCGGNSRQLCVSSIDRGFSYTIAADFTIISEVKQLLEDYIPDTIQRVGGDIVLPSSTTDSIKKFKITVDDSGTMSTTNTTDNTYEKIATEDYVDTQISAIDVGGQISTHNSDASAHSDIRTSISNLNTLVGDTAVASQITNAVEAKLDKDDCAWTQIYDSGAITTAVNAISGINVSGYKSLKVAIKCVNTTANSATAGGAIVFTCENGQDYVFANILGNLIRNTASISGGAADFKVLDNYLACECSYRALNAENMLSDTEGAGADNLTTLCGGCYIKCTSPISTMMITNATQSDSLYYGVGSRVVVWGCKS